MHYNDTVVLARRTTNGKFAPRSSEKLVGDLDDFYTKQVFLV